MSTVGQRIRRLRKAKGFTQTALAELIGVKPHTLSEIEGGQTKELSASTLAGLCREFRVTPDYLLWEQGFASEEEERAAEIESEMLYILRSMNDTDREAVMYMARGFFEKRGSVLAPAVKATQHDTKPRITGGH